MISWNILGILLWVIAILYLFFVIQNIRKRRIAMIIKKHKHFTWTNFIIDLLEVIVLILAAGCMLNRTLFDNPDLEDTSKISSVIEYHPLVMSTGTGNSSYVTISSSKKKVATQTYTYYQAGSKNTVSSNSATVADGKNPLDINAEKIPYQISKLKQMDKKYQNAYVAIYTARYKKNWQNGIGMHAGHVAIRYYLIRVPDASFIKQKQLKM